MKKLSIFLFALVIILGQFACGKDESAVEDIKFSTPTNFPSPAYDLSKNEVTKAGFELGRRLFYDPIFSRDSTIACGDCHISYSAFSHPDHGVSHGIDGLLGIRNAPAVQNMAWRTSFFWDGAVGFQNGGSQPTSNVGPWLKNGNEWVFFNSVTGTYDLTVYRPGDIMMAGGAVDETTGWLLCNGRQFATSAYPSLFGAIGYNYLLPTDKSGGNPIDPTQFRIPNAQGRVPLGAGTGSGLTTRVIGEYIGEESVTLTEAQLPAHQHIVPSGVTATMTAAGNPTYPAFGLVAGGARGGLAGGPCDSFPLTSGIGSGQAHGNTQPSWVVNFKIKT
jgi:microcystin-dependent protein